MLVLPTGIVWTTIDLPKIDEFPFVYHQSYISKGPEKFQQIYAGQFDMETFPVRDISSNSLHINEQFFCDLESTKKIRLLKLRLAIDVNDDGYLSSLKND